MYQSYRKDFILLWQTNNKVIARNFPLKQHNTFGLDYQIDTFMPIKSEDEAVSFLKNKSKSKSKSNTKYPLFILGGGSNLLFTSDYMGTIIHVGIEGISIEEEHTDYVIVSVGAGVIWDDLVKWTVDRGYGGLENLSLIPGLTGASPVQNIGAYGTEVKDTIIKVRTVSIADGSIHEFTNSDCRFGYRNSIFKNELRDKYLISRVSFALSTRPVLKVDYGSLGDEIAKMGDVSLENVRKAVINIRKSKLPDPEIIGNAGSFFKNPVVGKEMADQLKRRFPNMPFYDDQSGGVKIAAGWLIEQAGWKGKRVGDAGIHDKQALVIVNYGKATGKEIYALSEAVKYSVFEQFGVILEREVQVVGTT